MKLYLINHAYRYECEKVCRIYYPAESFEFITQADGNFTQGVLTEITQDGENTVFHVECIIGEKSAEHTQTVKNEDCADDYLRERYLARSMVACLTEITGIVPPWGILTGVRPSKLMLKYIEDEGEEEAVRIFRDFLCVSSEKTELARSVALREMHCISLSQNNSCSVYVSIPFCPSRCSYCSFVSHSIAQAKKLIPDYVRLLCEEIEFSAQLTKKAGLKTETVYIGGGTPTSLEADDLEKICDALNTHFDARNCREFTVEAGRPDTITERKLRVLKNAGVNRISINPQTFIDSVLEKTGRKHTAQDTVDIYKLARTLGFDNINMDFIAGLPGDTPEGFRQSILKAVELEPENITVHTLALKTAATLVTGDKADTVSRETAQMLEYSNEILRASGYIPYYMYRQSKSVGNLENVGWCKPGTECLYNIYMMEEIHSIMAMGGGAVTKLVEPGTKKIERVYNFKYPYEYISRFDEIRQRKCAVILPGGATEEE